MSVVKSTCVLCGTQITKANDSAEHVMPNALGGRLKVRGFICKSCNDCTGHTWDAELARQLQALCLLIGVERERGETPPMTIQTTSGQVLRITANDGLVLPKPTYEATPIGTDMQIRISARTMEEARQMIQGAKAKYPTIDVEASLARVQQQWSAPDGYMQHCFQLGGLVAGRSIVKSALAFAHHSGLSLEACTECISFLRGPAETPAPLGWYYASDVVEGRPQETPLTCVGIHAAPTTGLILAYAEYFGIHRAVIELGQNYKGPEVRAAHGFDPRNSEILDLSVNLPFDSAEVAAIFDYQRIPDGAQEQALNQVLPRALKRQVDSEQERVLGAAVEHALLKSGLKPGDVITEEHAKAIGAHASHYLTPWLLHRISQQRRVQPVPPPEALCSDSNDEGIA